MIKRAVAAGAVVGLVALTAGSVAPAASADGDGRHTIRVIETLTEQNFVDNGESGPSLGDLFVFSADLTRKGKEVGHAGVTCTVVSVERQESQCVATAWFDKRGQITVQGLAVEGGEGVSLTFAITGGTGKFKGASGEVVVTPLSETRDRLVFKLER